MNITCKGSTRIDIGEGAWAEYRSLTAAEFVTWQRKSVMELDGGMRYVLHRGLLAIGGFKDESGTAFELSGPEAGNYLCDQLMPAFADKMTAIIIDDSKMPDEEKKPYGSFFARPLKNAKDALGSV